MFQITGISNNKASMFRGRTKIVVVTSGAPTKYVEVHCYSWWGGLVITRKADLEGKCVLFAKSLLIWLRSSS